MSTIIQIKRSTAITAPVTADLAEAELAYAQDKSNDGVGAKLYIESLNNDGTEVIHAIGGKYYTDKVDAATDANTASAIVKRDGSGNFSAGTITAALTGNASTATALATARDIGGVSFDGTAAINLPGVNAAGNQNTTGTAAAWTTARTLTLSGDATGTVSIDGSGDLSLAVTVTGAEASSLTGDMTGDVFASNGTSKVLENGTDGTDATFTGAVTGNASTATALATARDIGGVSFDGTAAINLPGVNTAGNQDTSGTAATATLAADATKLATARAISVSGDATGTVNFDGSADANITVTLANSGVSANTYGSTTEIPVVTVDAKGRVTGVTTSSISTSFTLSDGSNTSTIAGGNTLTVNGTANEVAVAVSQDGDALTISLPDDVTIGQDLSVSRDLTVTGNLTVNGTTTTLATTNSVIADTLIELGNGLTGTPANDSGIIIERGTQANAFMGWDESADKFTMGTTAATGATTGDLAITVGTLVANIEGNISGGTVSGLSAAIVVADGGTGAGTFTSNGIVFGNGTGALQVTAAGTNGYFLYSNSGTPAWTNIMDGGSY